MTENDEYVIMPQNDFQQIEQIVREYESEPAKGLTHGIQKDAIQNGIGARLQGRSEPNSYRDWMFVFELLKIKGKYALSFLDEGTTGLIGDILTANEIDQWSNEGRLTSDQKLGRFLTRFESGDSIGPGSFGRGKLIFQGASKTSSIICDSIRSDDGKYIAFERKIIGNRLQQTRTLYQNEDAEQFIEQISGGALLPLTRSGTRIIILDLKDEIIESIKKSFNTTIQNNYFEVFIKMIEETWWEIIDKFSAKIFVKWDDKIKQVELSETIRSTANAKDGANGWKIYKKELLPVVIGNRTYKIKELKFTLAPKLIHEDLRDVWIQRKRMKIGSIFKGITPHHVIQERLCGYVILDQDLEDLVLLSEGTTHYSFRQNGRGVAQIKQIVRSHLEDFQRELGLRKTSGPSRARQDMLDTVKELNENALNLGLISEFSSGITSKEIEITIQSFELPNDDSKRVEINQPIGPITLEIKNNSNNPQLVNLFLNAEQRGEEQNLKPLFNEEIDLDPEERKIVTIEEFQFKKDDFRYGEAVLIIARINNRKLGSQMCQVSRMIWLGREEPLSIDDPFVVTVYQPLFPRSKSRRVELTEYIHNIRFKISNNTAFDVKINSDLVVRKAKSPSADVQVLKELISERDFLLPAMSDKEFSHEDIFISNELFGLIFEGPAKANERKCEIYFSARAAENIRQLNLVHGKNIGKRKIEFYLGIDPPGLSIFKDFDEWNAPDDGKRSRYDGDRASGYVFLLNVGHRSYQFANDNGDEVRRWYIREQMTRQAYAITFTEGEFRGITEEFSEILTSGEVSSSEIYLVTEEIIGKALMELGG